MTGLDRKGDAVIPACGGAGVIGGWPFTAHLVQAVSLAGGGVIPALDKFTGVKMGATVAFIVDTLTVEHQWTAHAIEFRQTIKRHHIGDNGAHDIRDWWTSRDFHDRLVGDHFIDRRCLGRIGAGGLDATPGGAVSQAIIALAPAALSSVFQ